jgi:hypothetical protein
MFSIGLAFCPLPKISFFFEKGNKGPLDFIAKNLKRGDRLHNWH